MVSESVHFMAFLYNSVKIYQGVYDNIDDTEEVYFNITRQFFALY